MAQFRRLARAGNTSQKQVPARVTCSAECTCFVTLIRLLPFATILACSDPEPVFTAQHPLLDHRDDAETIPSASFKHNDATARLHGTVSSVNGAMQRAKINRSKGFYGEPIAALTEYGTRRTLVLDRNSGMIQLFTEDGSAEGLLIADGNPFSAQDPTGFDQGTDGSIAVASRGRITLLHPTGRAAYASKVVIAIDSTVARPTSVCFMNGRVFVRSSVMPGTQETIHVFDSRGNRVGGFGHSYAMVMRSSERICQWGISPAYQRRECLSRHIRTCRTFTDTAQKAH